MHCICNETSNLIRQYSGMKEEKREVKTDIGRSAQKLNRQTFFPWHFIRAKFKRTVELFE